MKVLNAENKILGRAASEIAQIAKNTDEEIAVVKSEHVTISGTKEKVLDDYKTKYDRGRRDRGPYFPKRPDKIFKRTIKNMTSNNKKGREQESQIKTYLGVPEEFEDEEIEDLDVREGTDLKNRNYVKLGEVSEHIGWTPRVEVKY